MKFTNTTAAVVGIDTSSSGEGQNGFPGRRTSQRPTARRQLIKTLRVMKLTAIILLAACLQLSARSNAQDKVTLLMKDAPLEKVLRALEKQGNYIVWCEKTFLIHTAPVTVQIKNVPLDQAMVEILKDQPLKFTIIGNVIVLSLKDKMPATISPTVPDEETIDVKGKVTNEKNEPLYGASIQVKDASKGTVTDKEGNYTIQKVKKDATLIISYTGYSNQEIRLNGRSFIIVALSVSTNPLDAVQIIAYGTTSQRLSTGNVVTVTSKEIEQQPVANPLAAMEGRVPGLVISQTSGNPGGAFAVQIRGQNSLLNGNDPFYVIDGVPCSSQTVNIINPTLVGNSNLYGYNHAGGNPLNYINPADIESISILKDADATSIYGSRAANGAILITTKQGRSGDSRLDVNLYTGIGKISRMLPVLNTAQYLTMRHEAFNNDGTNPSPNSDFDLTFWDTTRYTNWQKALIGNQAHYYDAQVSVSAGSENIAYLIGGGYHRETSVFPGTTADQKASAHFNLNSNSLNRKFKISLTANYTADMSNIPPIDITFYALTLPPDAPALYAPDGTLNWAAMAPGQLGTWTNPMSNMLVGYRAKTNNLVSNALVSYSICRGLNIGSSFGYTHTQTNEIVTNPTTSNDPGYYVTSGFSLFNSTSTSSWIIEPQATYSLGIGKGILKALAGTTFQENATDGQEYYASGFSTDELLQDVQAATSVSVQSAISTSYKYNAIFGRLNYNWQDKYIITATARRDGSSRFGPGSQFSNFGSISWAWIFSNESFIQNSFPFISFGKLRASYGTSGSDQVGDYRFLDLYMPSQYPYQNSQGLYPANLFNPNLAWEFNKKLEGGIMLGVLKDRISAEVSYYVNRSGNQLVVEPLSAVTGFGSIPANLAAVVQNSGIELSLNTINIKSRNFKWSSSFNLSAPRNRLISFPNLASSPYATRWIIGEPISIAKKYVYAGLNDSAGIYQFTNSKGDKTFKPNFSTDRTAIVNSAPKIYGSFENSFSFNGFQLDILFQFVNQKGENINGYLGWEPGFMANQPIDVFSRWQKLGDMKPYEQFTQSYGSKAHTSYSYYYQSNAVYTDASFIRLKNLAFSYKLSENALHKMHIRNLRLYVNGQNLVTITRYLGLDPESQGDILPPLKVLVVGVQFGL